MKILHTFSNWKWTGPAEPALNLAWHQLGDNEVLFASGRPPDGEESRIVPHAERRAVPCMDGLELTKHARFFANRADARRMAALLHDFRPDVVHTHMENDHRVASVAVASTGIGRVVRTAYDPEGFSGSRRTRRTARRALDGLILTSRGAWDRTLELYGGLQDSISVAGRNCPAMLIEGGIDLQRFDASRFDREAARARLGLAPGDVAVGIVARVQSHRRFEILLEAHERVVARHPQLKLVVIGRGTKIKELLLDPVEQMGLASSVLTTGYLHGEDYPAALSALDVTLFLVPGTDGTCRALREQMGVGLPGIVTTRAPLPDIIEDGRSGVVVEESADGLEHGLEQLVGDTELRQRMAAGALESARRRFDLPTQARTVAAFYDRVLAGAPAL